ncbi:MAG: hypothetical protein CMK89_16770 [Pseudomonadales bacterium]|nr:hypothetical protein [Pseudomonadales bacterium]RLU03021.1 MAG: hypothetical protein D9N11_06210 [Ketobacter sp.]
MNQAIRPVVYAISLYLVSGGGLLTGCASQPAKPVAETSSKPAEPEPAVVTATETKPEPYEYKAIPFEEVLKQDAEAASRQPAQKPVLPTGEDAPKYKPSTPLRPPKETPPPAPEKPTLEAETKDLVVQAEEKPVEPETAIAPEPVATLPQIPTPIEFTLDQLPITIGNSWVLSSNQDSCSLQTVPVTMNDGTGTTPLSLRLSKDSWIVETKSDIDMTYPDTGLFLSNGIHIPLESIVKDTKISISKQKQQLTNALKASDSVRVALGFWPTWPMTETQSQTISVANFPQALAAWETCNQKVSAR